MEESETKMPSRELPAKNTAGVDENLLLLVLHVDDETSFMDVTKQILELKAPIHVFNATSVDEAKEVLKTKKVDAIISDYEMPIKNGLDFLKELRETNNNIPFILLTGRGREEVAIEALNDGANGYINKFGKPETVFGQVMHAIFSSVKAKRAEDDLIKFKTISDKAGYGVMLIDLDGKMLYVNESLAKMHGYKVNELMGKNHSVLHTKDEFMRVERSKKKLFKKSYLVMEEQHLKKDGSLLPVLCNVTLINDPTGTPSFVAVIITDITEQKKAEQKLKESEGRLRDTLDNMIEGCQIIDYNWRYLYVNDTAAKHGRTTKQKLLGKTMMEMYPGIEETRMFSVLRRCMEERTSEQMENEFSYSNGKKSLFELRIQPVTEGIFILSIDVTERKLTEEKLKQSEAWYRAVFENTGTAMCIIEEDKSYSLVNREFEKLSGYSQEELKTKKWTDFVTKECLERMKKYHETRRKNGEKPPKQYTFDYVNKKGQIRNAMLTIDTIPGTKKSVASILDITERKKAENALRHSVDELALVNEKLNVVGTLTRHDVRNKLSVVAGNIHIAKELLPPDSKAIKYLGKTEPAFDQIGQIFERARTYQMLGVDKPSYIDVKRSCEETFSFVHDFDNIKLVKDCDGLTVYADSLLGQLFYNLVDNSIKHGEKVTEIRVYFKESKDGLKLIYEDDGVGIDKAENKKIFEKSYGKGTGIGLHMIQALCNLYGWTIEERGKKGKGAQFTMTIPKKTKNGKKAYILSSKEQ